MKNPIIQRLVKNLGRFDSNETIFFARELETIDPTAYMELYAGLVGRSLVPRIGNVDPLDLTYTYRMWKVTGQARVGGPHSNDNAVVGAPPEVATIGEPPELTRKPAHTRHEVAIGCVWEIIIINYF